MQITIFTANCRGRKSNTLYPNKCIIDSEEDLSEIMKLSQEAIAGQPNGSGGSPA